MLLENKTDEELRIILETTRKKVQRLMNELSKQQKIVGHLVEEMQKRDNWNAKVVHDSMLQQLEAIDIKKDYAVLICHDIKNVMRNHNSYFSSNQNKARRYKQGDLVRNIYFDLGKVIDKKLQESNLIDTKRREAKYTLRFEFDRSNHRIVRHVNTNIFSDSLASAFKFKLPIEELKPISRTLSLFTNKYYNDYADIIPDLSKLYNYIDEELEAVLLAHYLSNN